MMGLPGGRGVCGGSCFEPLGRWLSWFYPSLGEALALGTHHEHALLSIGTSDALRPACSIRASGHLVCMRSFGLAVGLAFTFTVFLCCGLYNHRTGSQRASKQTCAEAQMRWKPTRRGGVGRSAWLARRQPQPRPQPFCSMQSNGLTARSNRPGDEALVCSRSLAKKFARGTASSRSQTDASDSDQPIRIS